MLLVPFEFRIGRRHVAPIVVVEQTPVIPLDWPAHFSAASTGSPFAIDIFTSSREAIEIGPLAVERLRPGQADGTMPGNDAHGGDAPERVENAKPALHRAVYDRQMPDENEVACE